MSAAAPWSGTLAAVDLHPAVRVFQAKLMNRFCDTHSPRGLSRSWRLLLAVHSYDHDAEQQVIDEAGDCSQCLRDLALAGADAAHGLLLAYAPLPGIDDDGLVIGETVNLLLSRIDGSLRAEQLDRRDLGWHAD